MALEQAVAQYTSKLRQERLNVIKDAGSKNLGTLNARDILLGLRGTPALHWEHSWVTSNGLVLRNGRTLADLRGVSVERLLLLFLTGQISGVLEDLQHELIRYDDESKDDYSIYSSVVHSLDSDTPVITQLISALLALHGPKSRQGRRLRTSLSTQELWKDTLVDVLYLITILPKIAGLIMANKHGARSSYTDSVPGKHEFSFAREVSRHLIRGVIGVPHENVEGFISLYLVLHADHGGGNASAHTSRLVSSTLADPVLSLTSALCSLSGPLHGGANGEAFQWMQTLYNHVGKDSSDKTESVRRYTRETIKRGEKIPGFGHAVLGQVDPRVVALLDYAASDKALRHHPYVTFLRMALPEIGSVLREEGKVRSPHPNVDAVSGMLLRALVRPAPCSYSGAVDMDDCIDVDLDSFTADLGLLLFSLGRSVGVLSHVVLDRAIGAPLERPDSLPLGQLVIRSRL
jgi:citrate synthase